MNELVAVVYLVVKQGEYDQEPWETGQELGVKLCGAHHSEADVFILFSSLMALGLRDMFTIGAKGGGGVGKGRDPGRQNFSVIGELPRSRRVGAPTEQVFPTSAILARCIFINDTLLKIADHVLYDRLRSLEIEPQVYLLRWLRLLFSREFGLEDTVFLWDAIFVDARQEPPSGLPKYSSCGSDRTVAAVICEAQAASAALPLVDYFAVALLRALRNELLVLDQTDCLRRLLSSSPVKHTRSLIEEARDVRSSIACCRARPPDAVLDDGVRPQTESEDDTVAPSECPRVIHEPQFFSVASLGARGLLDKGRQAIAPVVQRISQLSSELDTGHGLPHPVGPAGCVSASAVAASSMKTRCTSDQDQETIVGAASALPPDAAPLTTLAELLDMQRRVLSAEQERDTIKRKANEFFASKKAEWNVQISNLQSQMSSRDNRIAELEERLAKAEAMSEHTALQSQLASRDLRIAELEERLAEAERSEQQVRDLQKELMVLRDAAAKSVGQAN